jgi:hypothetical protein
MLLSEAVNKSRQHTYLDGGENNCSSGAQFLSSYTQDGHGRNGRNSCKLDGPLGYVFR